VILVVAEQRDGALHRVTLETVAAAQALAGGMPIAAVVIGTATGRAQEELAGAGIAEVLVVEDPLLEAYTPDGFALALGTVVTMMAPHFVLLPHTYQTRDFAPFLAAQMRRSIVTDVVAIDGIGADAMFVRPMFQGKLLATVKPLGTRPFFVTFQVGAFRADAVQRTGSATIRHVPVSISGDAIRQRTEPPFREARQAVDLSQAERIVAVGRGIKSLENLEVAERLAKAIGAEIAASRPICDNGWLPMDRQVGSSGQTVSPKLYLALGISGAIQHLVGMKGSRTIVAINKDPDAPIFEVADYGIVGDLFEIVPAMMKELETST
jgi:electron transfer flavoprotein alpha subunit